MREITIPTRVHFSRSLSGKHLAIVLALSLTMLLAVFGQTTCLATTNLASSPTAPSIRWEQTYSCANSISRIVQTIDGGYVLVGFAMDVSLGAAGPLLIKVDSQGDEQWVQSYYSQEENSNLADVSSIVQTDNEGYALAGSNMGGSNLENTGTYLAKTDSQGNILWRQGYMIGEDVDLLIKTQDGGYLMAGSCFNGGYWLAKVNSIGTLQWSRTHEDGDCISIIQTSDGGYALVSFEVTSDRLSNVSLIKTDSYGNMLWNRTYGDSLQFLSLTQTSDGGYALAGNTFGSNGTFLLIKTDSQGKMLWNQTYSSLGSGAAFSVIQTSDGGYALGCGSRYWSSGNLVKTGSDGNLQWNLSCSGIVYTVVQTSDGGYTFAGDIVVKQEGFLVRTNSVPDALQTPTPTVAPLQPKQSPYLSAGPSMNDKADEHPDYYLILAVAIAVVTLIVIALATKLRRSDAWSHPKGRLA